MSSPTKRPEPPETNEARAWRALAAAVSRGWRIGPEDRRTLKQLAAELRTSVNDVKRAFTSSALLQIVGDWLVVGRLIDADNIYEWFDESIRAARRWLYQERVATYRHAPPSIVEQDIGHASDPLDLVLAIERESERDRQLQAQLESDSPKDIGRVYDELVKDPEIDVPEACHRAGVPPGRIRAFRHRHQTGP